MLGDPALSAIRTFDDGVRRGAAGPGGRYRMSAFINPHASPSTNTAPSLESRASSHSHGQPLLEGAINLESFAGYISRDSTYYRTMDGPGVVVRTWYVILIGLRVGIVKDLYVCFNLYLLLAYVSDLSSLGSLRTSRRQANKEDILKCLTRSLRRSTIIETPRRKATCMWCLRMHENAGVPRLPFQLSYENQ